MNNREQFEKWKNSEEHKNILNQGENAAWMRCAEIKDVEATRTLNRYTRAMDLAGKEIDAMREDLNKLKSENYIQVVPDKCDRIIWKNQYYRLGALAEMKCPQY